MIIPLYNVIKGSLINPIKIFPKVDPENANIIEGYLDKCLEKA